ncbi:TonB-dependent receptor [Sphingopyxis sp.]|uniref:TonB-dependent receptor n=1 Tax=Sphingopyxis sp. TaxID=1908224 RepID=UPI002FC65CF9
MNYGILSRTALAALLGSTALTTSVYAQSTQDEAGRDEIIVTATKRDTTLQEVPMSISAVSGAALEKNGISDFQSLAASVPSLSFRSAGPGRQKLTLRGLSSSAGVAPTVSFYIDDMPVSSVSSAATSASQQSILDPNLYDLDHVEILRGPQGTLYGSSSMGGTVRLITKQPNLREFQGKLLIDGSTTRYGGENFALNGALNIPIVQDVMALRLVGTYSRNDGYIDKLVGDFPVQTFLTQPGDTKGNPVPPIVAREAAGPVQRIENVNSDETLALRGALRIQSSDGRFSIQPYIFYQKIKQDGAASFDSVPGELDQRRRYDVSEPYRDRFILASGTIGYDFDWAKLTSASSYIDRKTTGTEDVSDAITYLLGADVGAPWISPNATRLRDFTQEIRLTSADDKPLTWLLGYYYKHAKSAGGYRVDAPAGVLPPGFEIADVDLASLFTEHAVFGEIAYKPVDRLTVSVGARYFENRFVLDNSAIGQAFGNPFGPAAVVHNTTKQNGVNPKFLISYEAFDDGQLYVTAAKGSRPGGVNIAVPADRCATDLGAIGRTDAPDSYGGDRLWSYEGGVKTRLGRSATLNVAAFYIDWTRVQQSIALPQCGFSYVDNAGSARSVGFEAQFDVTPVDGMRLSGGVGYADAQITRAAPGTGLVKGQQLLDAPKWTINLQGEYSIPVGSGELSLSSAWSSVDKSLDIFNGSSVFDPPKPAYNIVDFRATYSFDHWALSLYVKNAFDERAIYNRTATIVQNIPVFRRVTTNRPRTFGVSLSADF